MTTRYILNIREDKINKRNSKQAQKLKDAGLDGKECYYKISVNGKYWCFADTPQGFKVPESMLTEIKSVKTSMQSWDDTYAGKRYRPTEYQAFEKGWDACLENQKIKAML